METVDNLLNGIHSEWAILMALFLLLSFSAIRFFIEKNDKKKSKLEWAQSNQIQKDVRDYLAILASKYTEEVTERQLPILIRRVLENVRTQITIMVYDVITRNDISNHEREVKAKVQQFIQNQFSILYMDFGLFRWKGKPISNLLDTDYQQPVIENLLEIIVNVSVGDKKEAYKQVGSFMEQKFDCFITETLSNAYELKITHSSH